ncbi:MAG TPA: ROK family transcriptional regulator [Polyangiaceae bacterium]|nr:ROK family transcriptional regulator [Polyangiaceae bacterium]
MPAVPSSLRLANQATLLEQLLERKAASRAELAKATGMSQPTAGKIIDDLVHAGVVEEIKSAEVGRQSVGRPGKQLRLSTSRPRFVVMELGVEWTRISALPPSPPDIERWDVQFKTPNSEAAWQEKLFQNAERIDVKRPWAVLVAAPGIIDEKAGRVLLSPNLHWSEHADLQWMLRQVWPAPVGLIQEVRAAALGELGTRPDSDDFLMVDIAEGIGGALMLARRPYQGALPMSGEIGHTPIPGNTRPCGCGGRGCLETLASERGMVQSLREVTKNPNATFADVVKATEKELPQWLRSTFDAVAMCIAAALNLYGVRRAVLVGRVTELPTIATDYLVGAVQRASMWSRFDAVAVSLAPKRRARGLVVHGIHRFVMPSDWSRKR